jgi:uncharacterized heparinase superfamily protein
MDWFHDLAEGDKPAEDDINPQSAGLEYCRDRLDHWISNNRPGSLEGWHPYCISLRLVNILSLWPLLSENQTDKRKKNWLDSLWQQADFLSRHTEKFLSANHYMENAIALCLSELFFKGSPNLQRLQEIIRLQVLPDGGHYEGSYGYHIRMTDRLEYLVKALEGLSQESLTELPEIREIATAVSKMKDYSLRLTSRLKEAPLFADSWTGARMPEPETFKSETKDSKSFEHFPDSGLVMAELSVKKEGSSSKTAAGSGDTVIFRYGKLGAPDNPGHGHCDCTSYELFIDGLRLVCDSGNYDYKDEELRHYFRSSVAHNVAEVPDTEQSQVFGAFRAGRKTKGHFKFLALPGTVGSSTLAFEMLYKPVIAPAPNITITRRVEVIKGETLTITDRVRDTTNLAAMNRTGDLFSSHIHFVPEAKVRKTDDPRILDIFFMKRKIRLFLATGDAIFISKSPFAPDFGIMKEATKVTCTGTEISYVFLF